MSLASLILADPETEQAEPCFVSVYRTQRCYGGHEEGGWWYDVRAWQGGRRFPSRADAEAYLAQKQAEIDAQNRAEAPSRARAMAALPDCDEEPLPDAGEGYIPPSWSDGGTLDVVIEEQRAQSDNTHEPRPHYE